MRQLHHPPLIIINPHQALTLHIIYLRHEVPQPPVHPHLHIINLIQRSLIRSPLMEVNIMCYLNPLFTGTPLLQNEGKLYRVVAGE